MIAESRGSGGEEGLEEVNPNVRNFVKCGEICWGWGGFMVRYITTFFTEGHFGRTFINTGNSSWLTTMAQRYHRRDGSLAMKKLTRWRYYLIFPARNTPTSDAWEQVRFCLGETKEK